MKKSIFLVYTFFALNVSAQTTFQKLYSETNFWENCNSVEITSHGDYLVLGVKYSTGIGPSYLMKLDPIGNVIWKKDYSDINANTIKHTADGGYIISGTSDVAGAGNIDMCLLKIDSSGNIQWSKLYGTSEDDYASCAIQTPSGEYILTGNAYNYISDTSRSYVIKTDSIGNVIWDWIFNNSGLSFYETANNVNLTADGGIIITGIHTINNELNVMLMRILPTGNYISNNYRGQYYGGNSLQTSDGGFITTGYGRTATMPDAYLLFKTDSFLNVIWSKCYSNGIGMPDLIKTSDGGYALAGTYEANDDSASVYLIKTNSVGDTLWTKIYSIDNLPDSKGESAVRILQTADDGYIIGANYDRVDDSRSNFIIKTDAFGNSGCNLYHKPISMESPSMSLYAGVVMDSGITMTPFNPIVSNSSIIDTTLCFTDGIREYDINSYIDIYPNPATEFITLFANIATESDLNLDIIDLTGRTITSQAFFSNRSVLIDVNSLVPGIYFARIYNKEIFAVKKFVKQ